jgi:hypothetical protein
MEGPLHQERFIFRHYLFCNACNELIFIVPRETEGKIVYILLLILQYFDLSAAFHLELLQAILLIAA